MLETSHHLQIYCSIVDRCWVLDVSYVL